MNRTVICALLLACAPAIAKEHHYLYAASPGIRNYLEYGGMGIVVRRSAFAPAQGTTLYASPLSSDP